MTGIPSIPPWEVHTLRARELAQPARGRSTRVFGYARRVTSPVRAQHEEEATVSCIDKEKNRRYGDRYRDPKQAVGTSPTRSI